MEVQSIGLAGLQKAQEKLAAVAKRLATGTIGGQSSGADSVDPDSVELDPVDPDSIQLSAEMVALLESKHSAQANLKLVESANELASQTIDILG